jgi:5-methylthioadenosine/S-adenosylhomocysteine deaminase
VNELCDLLMTGGHVITMDSKRRVLSPGAVAITGERITAVGSVADLSEWTAAAVIDCSDRLVLPGLVDCHNHLFQALARGLGEGLSIWPWLCEFMWPYAIAVRSEDAQAAVRLGAVEALRAGTTSILDHHYAPTDTGTVMEVANIIEEAGMRGVVARGVLGDKSGVARARGLPDALFRYSSKEELAITAECMAERPPASRVTVWPGPLNLAYLDQDLLGQAVELARQGSTRWHTHCSEGQDDPTSYLEAYGIRPVNWLAREGLLDGGATLAHSIWLDDREIAALGGAGAGAVHNPASNGYLASGRMPLTELRAAGAVVGLGTDGPSCGHRQDLFEAMKQAVFLQRLTTLDPTVMRAEDALELATREGARMLGIEAGVLAPGMLADVITVRLDRPHLVPLLQPVSAAVYSARGGDVDTSVCGGRVVVKGGHCTLVDEEEAMAHAREAAERVMTRGGLGALRDR